MLGAVGALIPEGLSMAGVELGEPVWWKVRRPCLVGTVWQYARPRMRARLLGLCGAAQAVLAM